VDLEGLNDEVEISYFCDNKEMTIGEKRERLYRQANGLYSWQIDDDDCISADAIPLILEVAKGNPDCITFQEHVTIDGNVYRSNFSLKYSDWWDDEDGFDYVRTPFFKTPIKTELCRTVSIPHERFGEDHAFARLIKPLLDTEVHIPRELYFYNHVSSPHNERYGIVEE
jgi:hypothetical protein